MKDFIHVCVISDDEYAVPTTVMLTSAKIHKSIQTKYCIHVLCNNMSAYYQSKFLELSSDDFRIMFVECNVCKYEGIKMPPNITLSTMIKCDLAELLPNVDKVLLLDGDILVKKDLKELYEVDMSNKIVAATNDMVGMVDMKLHEIVGVERYFNAGVMLLNLKLMRLESIGEKIIDAKRMAPSTWVLGEQDPFNKVCDGHSVILPLSWNVEIALLRHMEHSIEDINNFYGTSYSSYIEMEDSAGILHFCCFKPWKNKLLSYAPLWQKYHDISPYGDTSLVHQNNYPFIPKITTNLIKLFGLFPIIRITENELRKECVLFGLFRLFKIQKRKNMRKVYLFGFFPLFSINVQVKEIK